MDDSPALRDLVEQSLARQDLMAFAQRMDRKFIPAAHLKLISEALESLEHREIRKLAVTMPPRFGKTRLISQLFAAWYLGKHPDEDIVLASYGSELAEGNSRAVRGLISENERYPFPGISLREDSRSAGRWQTEQGGTIIAAGVGSGLTGRGFHCGILDDAVKDRESAESAAIRASTKAWFQDVFTTRAAPDAIQVAVGTRWHADDLLSNIIARDDWHTINLPLICESDDDPLGRAKGEWLWPERFGPDDIPSVERGEISSRSFAALYQQSPTPAEGHTFLSAWFEHRFASLPTYRIATSSLPSPDVTQRLLAEALGNTQPRPRLPLLKIQSVDSAWQTSVQNDRSCIVTMCSDGRDIYITDVCVGRWSYVDLRRIVVEQFAKHRPSRVYVEAAASGFALIDELRRSTAIPVVAINPGRESKEAKAESVTGTFESGRVKFPVHAPWMDELLLEFLTFPYGKHDDICDAVVLGIRTLEATRRRANARARNEQLAQSLLGWMER